MKFFITGFYTLILSLIFSSIQGQVQVGVHGSYQIRTPKNPAFEPMWGFGVQARYFVNSKFAVGVTATRFARKDRLIPVTPDPLLRSEEYLKYRLIPVTVSAEYFFTVQRIRPYIGMKVGSHFRKISDPSTSITDTFWGLTPKIGLQIPIQQDISLFAESEYNILLQKKKYIDTGFARTERYLQFNAGLLYVFGKK